MIFCLTPYVRQQRAGDDDFLLFQAPSEHVSVLWGMLELRGKRKNEFESLEVKTFHISAYHVVLFALELDGDMFCWKSLLSQRLVNLEKRVCTCKMEHNGR